MSGTRTGWRVIADGQSPRDDPVARLHRFQGEHPEVDITSPQMGGRGRYIAVIPPGTIPGESWEITAKSLDLTGLMDHLVSLLEAHSESTHSKKNSRGQ